MPNKMSLSKEGVQNIQEQAMSQSRQNATRGLRPGQHAPGTALAGASTPQPQPQKQMPIRSEKKFGRNDMVSIRKGDEVKVLKYKKAEIFLEQGWHLEGPSD
jgi:hypothetical protein